MKYRYSLRFSLQAIRYPTQIWPILGLTGFLLVVCLQVYAYGYTQKVSISGTDIPLRKVFASIEKQTGYVFFYDSEILKDAKNVTLSIKDVTIEEALKECLKDQPFDFKIVNTTISISKKNVDVGKDYGHPPLITSPQLRGTVKSESGLPMAGATVTIINRKIRRSVITNAAGEFDLYNLPFGKYYLEISFVGYQTFTKEVQLGGPTIELSAFLKQALNSLEETVIKGYYNTTGKYNIGSVTTVKGDEIDKEPVTDVLQALEAKVPGLYIQQTSGTPGAYSTVTLRGKNSISSGAVPVSVNYPLYIIDGIPFSGNSLSQLGSAVGTPSNGVGQGLSPFNVLNLSDIESVVVLKDADATAIYGSRGANGVILITTKKGKSGNTQADLNVYAGVGRVARKLKLLNTQQFLQMRHEAFLNDGMSPDPTYDYDLTLWDTTRYTDWQKALIGNSAQFTNAQASVSGGDINTQFIFGGGYSKQTTVFPGSYSDKKGTFHTSLNHSSADHRFQSQLIASYISDNDDLPNRDLTSNITLAPDAPALYDANGGINWQINNGSATWPNPIASTFIHAGSIITNLLSRLNLSYDIIPGLKFSSGFGYNRMELKQTTISPAIVSPPPSNLDPNNRFNFFASSNSRTWIVEPQISYKKAFNKGQLDALIGATFQEDVSDYQSFRASGFTSDALIPNPAAASSVLFTSGGNTLYRYNAGFGRIGYTLQDKYLFNLTGRHDGSSRFGTGKQFGNFGSAGVGWIFSNESFVKDHFSILSFGKLRFTYGTTGNDHINDYIYLSTYRSIPTTYQGITGLSPAQLTNPYLAWEVVKKVEIGLDLGLIKNRILFNFSYYKNRTGNQLVPYALPTITGFSSIQYNLPAVIQNTGCEFVLSTVNIQTKNFNWSSSMNVSIPRNKLIAFPGIANTSYSTQYAIGHSLYSKFVYHSTGVDPNTGIYTFATKNQSGVPSFPADLIISKPVTQDFFGGFQNDIKYKNFQLEILIQFVKQLGYNYLNNFSDPPGNFDENELTEVLKRWQKPGDKTNVGQFTQNYGGTAYTAYQTLVSGPTDALISNASFIRLKTLAISYDLSSGWMKRAHLKNAKVYLQCQNLFTITNYLGIDPETQGLSLPPLQMVTVGFRVAM